MTITGLWVDRVMRDRSNHYRDPMRFVSDYAATLLHVLDEMNIQTAARTSTCRSMPRG